MKKIIAMVAMMAMVAMVACAGSATASDFSLRFGANSNAYNFHSYTSGENACLETAEGYASATNLFAKKTVSIDDGCDRCSCCQDNWLSSHQQLSFNKVSTAPVDPCMGQSFFAENGDAEINQLASFNSEVDGNCVYAKDALVLQEFYAKAEQLFVNADIYEPGFSAWLYLNAQGGTWEGTTASMWDEINGSAFMYEISDEP